MDFEMNDLQILALALSCALVLSIAALVLILLAVKRSRLKKGVYGRNKLYSVLKSYSALRSFRVLSDVTVKHGNKTAHFENLLVSFYGLLAVRTVNDKSEYYGERRSSKWTKISESEGGQTVRESVPNMVADGEDAMGVLREIFAKNRIYNLQIEQYIVLTRRLKRGAAQMFVSGCPEIMTLPEFKKQIHKVKYEKDNNVDVDAVIAAINSAR